MELVCKTCVVSMICKNRCLKYFHFIAYMRHQFIHEKNNSEAFQEFMSYLKITDDQENYKMIVDHLTSDSYLRFAHPNKDGSEIKIGRDGKMVIERFPIYTDGII